MSALFSTDQISKLSDFLDALDEWGCEDNDERAEAIAEFAVGGFDLSAYEEGRPELRVIQGGRPEPSAPSPAGVEVVAWQWRKKPWAGSADGSAKWSDWQNGRAADAAKFEPADYEERALVPAASLDQATRRAEEARTLVTEANNSLYGSQGYFHSLNGGAFDKYHLATGIENLKSYGRKEYRRAEAAEARCSALEQALEDEREACAKIAETLPFAAEHHPTRIAKAIRARALQSKKT